MTAPLAAFAEAVTWFAVLGAGAAVIKHAAATTSTLAELTPVALRGGRPSPEAEWWGGAAFAAMNVGFVANGVWAIGTGDAVAKRGVLLSTAVLFGAFGAAWLTRGSLTGKTPSAVRWQAAKIAGFSALFFAGFFVSQRA